MSDRKSPTENLNLKKQVIMPTTRDLDDAKKYGWPIVKQSQFAVFVKKVAAAQKSNVMSKSQIKEVQELLKALYKKYSYDLLFDLQLKDGVPLTKRDLHFIEEAQRIPEHKYLCLYEKSWDQSADDLEDQIKDWKSRNPGKEIIIVSEVYTNDMKQKVAVAKKMGVRRYAIKWRSYKKYHTLLSKFLATIRSEDLYSIVLGVTYTKHQKTGATWLLPALQFQANAVSRWFPWGGGPSPMTLVCNDWRCKTVDKADKGLADYEGKDRKELVSTRNGTKNSALSRIDTINQVSMMLRGFRPLSKELFERLFN